MLLEFFPILMWVFFLFILSFYGCYSVVLYYYYRKSHSHEKNYNFIHPTISIIVPVHNEESIIAQKVQNIEELIYPKDKIEVIFVDGQSKDKTREIILDQAQKCQKSIRLIKQEKRDGYTNAVITGILGSKGEVIVAMDAASYHYPDAMEHLVKHFSDPKIGVVTGKEIVLGDTRQTGPQLEKSYRFFYDFMRSAETEIDSTPDSKGEILAVRREICLELIPRLKLSTNASFDSCVPYQAKLMDYRTVYEQQAKYYEYAPASSNDRLRVQIRRATVLIVAMFLFKRMLLNKKYGKFGLVIFPAHFVLDCILPSLFMAGIITMIISAFLNPVSVLPFLIIATIALVVSNKTRSVLLSFIQSQLALFFAIFRVIRRRDSLFIESIPSTRAYARPE